MTDRLLLLRHGLTEHTGHRLSGWQPGVHLSERGRAQAAALAERLREVPIDAIYASPLERCRQTVQPLAEARGLEVRVLEDLGEVRFGDWTGREFKELTGLELWKLVQWFPSGARFPGGESLYEVQARAVRALERLRAEHPGKTLAVCSHADVIKAVTAHYLGLHLDLFQRLEISPASLTALVFAPTPRLVRLNDTGGTADLLPPPGDERAQGDGAASETTREAPRAHP